MWSAIWERSLLPKAVIKGTPAYTVAPTPQELSACQKKQGYILEKHICVEMRRGAFRFKVTVHPHKDSATFACEKKDAAWARWRRQVKPG